MRDMHGHWLLSVAKVFHAESKSQQKAMFRLVQYLVVHP